MPQSTAKTNRNHSDVSLASDESSNEEELVPLPPSGVETISDGGNPVIGVRPVCPVTIDWSPNTKKPEVETFIADDGVRGVAIGIMFGRLNPPA